MGKANLLAEGPTAVPLQGSASRSAALPAWVPAALLLALVACAGAVSAVYVAVGGLPEPGPVITTSPDGIQWQDRMVAQAAAYDGSQWVAVGHGIYTSPDGVTWTQVYRGASGLNSVAYGGGMWIAVGDYGKLLTSPDGKTWTVRTLPVTNSLFGVAYGTGTGSASKWVAVGSTNVIIFSSDGGATWASEKNPGEQGAFRSVAYGGGWWAVAGDKGMLVMSLDGTAWSPRATGTTADLMGIAFGNGRWVTVGVKVTNPPPSSSGAHGIVLTSSDATAWAQWTDVSGTSPESLRAVAFGGGTWVAVGDKGTIVSASTPSSAAGWSLQSSGTDAQLVSVAFGGGQFLAFGKGGLYLASPNGSTWNLRDIAMLDYLQGVAYGAGQFVAVGADGAIFTSPDGKKWTQRDSGTTQSLASVTYGGGRWVAVGSQVALASADGVIWSSTPLPSPCCTSVATNRTAYVAVGVGGMIFSSPNGADWTQHDSGTTYELQSVASNGTLWMVVGTHGVILSSKDGTTWTTRMRGDPSPNANWWLYAVNQDGAQWITTGQGYRLMTSPDGRNWSAERRDGWVPSDAMLAVIPGGPHWILAGQGGIFTNPDGPTGISPWTYRDSPTSLSSIASSLPPPAPHWKKPVRGQTWEGILSNGVIGLGVRTPGVFTVSGDPARWKNKGCGPEIANVVSQFYIPKQLDGMDCDFEGEGWGIGYQTAAGAQMSGFAAGAGPSNLGSSNFFRNGIVDVSATSDNVAPGTDPRWATFVEKVGNLYVTQAYQPNPDSSNAYDDVITLTNAGHSPLQDLAYRRASSFHNSNSDNVRMTLANLPANSASPPQVKHSTVMVGFINAFNLDPWHPWPPIDVNNNPTAGNGPPDKNVYNFGPADYGAAWEFGFPGTLNPGHSWTFTLHYGAGANHDDAMNALSAIGARVYSLAQNAANSSVDPAFFMAFGEFKLVPPLLHVDFTFDPPSCIGGPVHFQDAGSNVFIPGGAEDQLVSWHWTFGDGATADGPEADHTFNPGRAHIATLTVTDLYGNTLSRSKPVAPDTDCPPILDRVPDVVIRLGDSLPPLCLFAADADDAPEELTWQVAGLPKGSTMDGAHCITWTPTGDQVGPWPIHPRVCDRNACDQKDFWLIVWVPPGPGAVAQCSDYDHDGICDNADDCPATPDYGQIDADHNGVGDACDGSVLGGLSGFTGISGWNPFDRDRDGIANTADNCIGIPNRDQSDMDADGVGDACDSDLDGDGIVNGLDNCPVAPNGDQRDTNSDGRGDACGSDALQFGSGSGAVARPIPKTPPGGFVPLGILLAGLAAGVALLAFLLHRFWPALVILFSRLAGVDLLQNPVRARLMALIEAEPGIHYKGLVKTLDVGKGNVEHHLRVLSSAGLVSVRPEGHEIRYYKAQIGEIAGRPIVLQSQRARDLFAYVQANHGMSLADAGRALHAPRTRVSYHAKRLAAAGLVRLEREGRQVRLYPL